MQENQLDRIDLIISEFREDIIQIQKFLEDSNVEESSPVFDNTTLFDEKIDTFGQEQESFITNFFKALSISVLLGEYIFIADFFKKLNDIEEKIKILPTSGDFLSSWGVPKIEKISEQIIEISSVIIILIIKKILFLK